MFRLFSICGLGAMSIAASGLVACASDTGAGSGDAGTGAGGSGAAGGSDASGGKSRGSGGAAAGAANREGGASSGGKSNAGTGGADGNAGSGAGASGAASGGRGSGGAGGASNNGGAGGASDGGAGGSGGQDSGFPGDTYLPWAGGPAYYSKWTKGPPADANYFPIAVWLQSPPNANRYKAIGINLFIGLWDGPTDEQLSTLKSAGVPVFPDQGGVWKNHLSDTTVWGWLQPDEPDNAQAKEGGGYDPCIDPSKIVSGYDTMVANDATRPVWLGLGRGVSDTQWVGRGTCTGNTDMYPEYAKGADILSFDIYPVNGGIGLEAVPKGVDNLRKWSDYKKPVIADIEGSNIDDTARPTPAQIKSEVWMALIHGAAGIQYFCHRFSPTFSETDCLDDGATSAGIKSINAQVAALAPVLNTQSVGNGVTVASSDSSKPIDVMLKRSGGATYLFAVEMRSGTTSGTFTLRDFPAKASAEAIGENRSIPVDAGGFKDDFSSYGVHLYKITK
jgi:hypothetical protein